MIKSSITRVMFCIWVLHAFSRSGEGNKNKKIMSVVNLFILDF